MAGGLAAWRIFGGGAASTPESEGEAVPGDPENKVGVSAFGRFIAVGRCARAEDPP